MNRDNFIVRMQLEAVNRFRERTAWKNLSDSDRHQLQREVAGLPSEIETDDIESRMFDLTALSMQLALVEGEMGFFEGRRKRMVEIAMLLEEKTTIPAVQAQLGYLAAMQDSGFWQGIDLNGLEELRLCLRGLNHLADLGQGRRAPSPSMDMSWRTSGRARRTGVPVTSNRTATGSNTRTW